MSNSKKKTCWNPFGTCSNRTKEFRSISAENKKKFKFVPENSVVCLNCRIEISEYKPNSSEGEEDKIFDLPDEEEMLKKLNTALISLDESKIDCERLNRKMYMTEKVESAQKTIKRKFEDISNMQISTSKDDQVNAFDEIITTLKEKFRSKETSRDDKCRILTTLPSYFKVADVIKTFGCSNTFANKCYKLKNEKGILSVPADVIKTFGCSNTFANKCYKLKNEKGILSVPDPKTGNKIAAETVDLVQKFYLSDENSRELPGIKDFVVVKKGDGKKEKIQKRLVYCNLRELYRLFKSEFPKHKTSFSKFAEYRPQECVLAGASGTHTVCVCIIHQNVKLMIEGSNLRHVMKAWEIPINGKNAYKMILQQLICSATTEKCYERLCLSCPSKSVMQNQLMEAFDDEPIEDITYKQWIATDRCTLKTLTESKEEFVSCFVEKLHKLLFHDFVATQQAQYFKTTKENLRPGEFVVTLDFSENFAFVVQEAVQGFHWNNNQATVHPMVIYFWNQETAKVDHVSYVGISDCLEHDTIAVFMFQQKLVEFLKEKFTTVTKIKYFSDGAPQQYKNKKNFVNLLNHFKDFSILAEWNFFATAHGKGACDGVGGTLKRLARQYCLQQGSKNEILTAEKLYEWANEHLKNVNVFFCSSEDYELSAQYLKTRFETCKTIKGTLGLHYAVPINDSELKVKATSLNSISKSVKV